MPLAVSVAVTVCEPGVFSVTPPENACMPLSLAVKVYSAGSDSLAITAGEVHRTGVIDGGLIKGYPPPLR